MRSERLGDLFNITQIKRERANQDRTLAMPHSVSKYKSLGEGRARESQRVKEPGGSRVSLFLCIR